MVSKVNPQSQQQPAHRQPNGDHERSPQTEESLSHGEEIKDVTTSLKSNTNVTSSPSPTSTKTVQSMQSVIGNHATQHLIHKPPESANQAQRSLQRKNRSLSFGGLLAPSEEVEESKEPTVTSEDFVQSVGATGSGIPPSESDKPISRNNVQPNSNQLFRFISPPKPNTASIPEELEDNPELEPMNEEFLQSVGTNGGIPPPDASDQTIQRYASSRQYDEHSSKLATTHSFSTKKNIVSGEKSIITSGVAQNATSAPIQRGLFGNAIKKGKQAIGSAGRAVVGAAQGGLVGIAKVALGPFWDLIEAARDKKNGKEVSFMGADSDKYMGMLEKGKEDPYGGGAAGSFATALSWVANVLLAKISNWTGFAALWSGVIGAVLGLTGGGAPFAPPFLAAANLLGQIATYAGLARGGLDIILAAWSGIRAKVVYDELPSEITGEDKIKRRRQYLMAVRELGSTTEGASAAASDVLMAGVAKGVSKSGAGNAAKNSAKAKAPKSLALQPGDAADDAGVAFSKSSFKEGISESAGKGLTKDTSRHAGVFKGSVKRDGYKNLDYGKVKTSKAEAGLADDIATRRRELADASKDGTRTHMSPEYRAEKEIELKNLETAHGYTGNTTAKAGEMRAGTFDDYWGETVGGVAGRAGGATASGAARGSGDEVGRMDSEKDWGGDKNWGDKNWGGKDKSQSNDENAITTESGGEFEQVYKKADLPTIGEKVSAGIVKGFLPFTVLLTTWRLHFKLMEFLNAGVNWLLAKLQSLAKYFGVLALPQSKIIEWVQAGWSMYFGISKSTNDILDGVDKGGEKVKEDATKE